MRKKFHRRLTPREKEIENLLKKGYKNKKIAEILFIEECTVKTHCSSIYKKLGCKGKKELIANRRNIKCIKKKSNLKAA